MPEWKGPVKQLDRFRYEIPRSYKPQMRTDGLMFVDDTLLPGVLQDQAPEQVANVATMPGIVGKAMAMPDIHWGYGFPIGGVAAFDINEGVVSPGGIGYDVNCLSGDSRVLTAHGYRLAIAEFEGVWRGMPLACVNPRHRTRTTDIAAYMRFQADVAYRVRTALGVEITATAEHPFLTPKGMIPLREVGSLPVAVYPFRGVDYEQPGAETLVTEETLAGFLPPHRLAQVIPFLRGKGLLPLTARHAHLPYLLKIMGLALGDGHASLDPRVAGVAIYGRREDLEEVRKDIDRLGWRPSRVYVRTRHHVITSGTNGYSFDHEEAVFRVSSAAFAAILHALGMPIGNKAKQDFVLPDWICRAPLWQKRLFLAALFGAEMSTPSAVTGHGYNLCSPTFSLSKREGYQDTGSVFANQIRRMLMDFGIRVRRVSSDILPIPGSKEPSYRFRVLVATGSDNLVRFFSSVNFEYNAEKRFLANAAAHYLTMKQMLLRHKERAADAAKTLRARGLPRDQIMEHLTGIYTSDSYLTHRLDGRSGKPRAWPPFPTFPEFVERLSASAGTSGVVWDRIESVEKVPLEAVYDFTVADAQHNFIADGFVVSNCGVRLIRTNLDENDVRPKIRELVDTMFVNVPSGVGSEGKIALKPSDLESIMTNGVQWAIDHGYGWTGDRERIEALGCLGDADPSTVGAKARARGIDQVGSLGAGNHFLEIQKVDRIYDQRAAEALGIGRVGEVAIMIHTGSRGFGHQIATDYIRICEDVVDREKIALPDRQLACAPIGSREGMNYWKAMCCGANFAWTNRQLITHWTRQSFEKVLGQSADALGMEIVYDVCHNIGKIEEHEVDGKRVKVLVHRKGATRAFPAGHPETPAKYRDVGQPVLIPGDMGSCSFVLVGLPTSMESSFGSSCHGAGRQMSRKAAERKFRASEVRQALAQKGIYLHAASQAGIVEEAPGAYKNVEDVVRVAEGAGLTKIVARMVPLGVVKG